MRKSRSFIWLLVVMFVCLFTPSCSDEKQKPEGEELAEVSFGVNIQDKSTRAMTDICLDDDSLQSLAREGLLKATISVIKATNHTQVAEDIVVAVRYTSSGFVADPIALPRGANKITAFTIHHQNNELYFSAVAEGSRYSEYVTETLPMTVTIGDDELYKKTSVDIYVLCAVSETAEDFGYIKWNIHFIRLYCLPFSVNVCDDDNNDVVGTGTLKIETGDYVNGNFNNITASYTTSFPPAQPGKLADMCFAVDQEKDPATTYVRITMTLTGKRPFSAIVKVEDLLNYESRPEWDSEFNYLHFNLCGEESWFFPNQFLNFNVINCPDNGDQQFASGYLLIYDNADTSQSSYIKGHRVDSVPFPNTNGMAQICIPNNYLVEDDIEKYRFELYTKYKGVINPLPVSTIVTVAQLLQYRDTDAWDLINRVLNINLCDCKNWIFPCQEYVLGTYVFEDLWPNPGDYDFNDLVVEYHLSKVMNTNNLMTRLELDCDLKALGAGYRNCAFAVRLDGINHIPGNHTVTRTCDKRDGNGYVPYTITGNFWHTLDNQKVEITPDGLFIVPVIENIDQKFRITHTGSSQINTYKNAPTTIGQGFKYRLRIDFATPISPDFRILPIEIPQADRAREINMPLVKPSANCNYLGLIGVDPNNPGSHKFFTYGATHRPWALDVPYLNIRYAIESNSILTLYNPEFDVWCSNLYVDPPTWWQKSVPANFFFKAAAYPELP